MSNIDYAIEVLSRTGHSVDYIGPDVSKAEILGAVMGLSELVKACENLLNSVKAGQTKIMVLDRGEWVEGNLDNLVSILK